MTGARVAHNNQEEERPDEGHRCRWVTSCPGGRAPGFSMLLISQ